MTLPGLSDGTLNDLVLAGSGLTAEVRQAVTSAVMDWQLDSASTFVVKLRDPHRTLVNSPLFSTSTTCHVDGVPFELSALRVNGPELELTFEHAVVAALRKHTTPMGPFTAGTMTRVDFARKLVAEESWIKLVVPLDVFEQPSGDQLYRGNPSTSTSDIVSASTGAPSGLPATTDPLGADATVDTNPWDQSSTAAGSTDTSAAQSDTSPLPTAGVMTYSQAVRAAAAAGFTGDGLARIVAIGAAESGLKVDAVSPPNTNGTVDRGWLQINSVHTQYDPSRLISDPIYCAQAAWDISGHGNTTDTGASFYQWSTYAPSPQHSYNNNAFAAHLADAQTAVDQNQGGIGGPTETASGKPSDQTQAPEDSWTCLNRVFGEVAWRVFTRGVDELWVTPDSGLYATGPAFVPESSVAGPGDPSIGNRFTAATFRQGDPGVDSVDFEWDVGQRTATASIVCRARQWELWPGDAVALPGIGPASGTWIISSVSRDLGTSTATIEAVQPKPSLPEPPTQPLTTPDDMAVADSLINGTDAWGGGTANSASSDNPNLTPNTQAGFVPLGSASVKKFVDFAGAVSSDPKAYYKWGGTGPEGYDCSGLVQAAAKSVGVTLPRTTEAMLAAIRGLHLDLPVDVAIRTYGALLFVTIDRDPSGGGHVAISYGTGRTVEAENPRAGIRIDDAGKRFNAAGLVPGLDYGKTVGAGFDAG